MRALPADHYETVAVQLAWTATDIEEVRGWEWAEHAPGKALTWAMHGPSAYLPKLMGLFFNMDQMIGKDFEAGLANLKQLAEKP